ncbi:helix-turn-helix domain-containing protein [Streptomyces rochei]|uniref:helix-turn-helix domain-containing protein n=1 Tax=Streptomyces rochei TaxID=1928 RepID=UPI0036F5073B
MPPKKKVDLPEHVRAAVLSEVSLDYEAAAAAEERSKIRIFLATEQGLSTYELAERLGVSQAVVSKWSRQGKEAWEARESARGSQSGEDPVRPGEPVPLG